MIRLPFEDLRVRIEQVLLQLGLRPERAALSSRLIAETDRDGVQTHGLARLPRFAEMVRLGRIDPVAEPERVAAFGVMERWAGHRGPGNVLAHAMTERAVELARAHGVGVVALGGTTHWMRGGSCGWQAADAGCALLAWTNTMPNLPPWGATEPALGNNPLIVSVPRRGGAHVVLDMAMSQFSYGTLASYRERGETLPFPGGFDEAGVLTEDPAAVERTQRALPVGLWKGSGLSFVLDLLGTSLAGGRATHEIPRDPLEEVGMSQVFLAVSPEAVGSVEEMERVAAGCIAALHGAGMAEEGRMPRYPGEGTVRVREESLRLGVGVPEPAWAAFVALEGSLHGAA